jgi:hypothetical protein
LARDVAVAGDDLCRVAADGQRDVARVGQAVAEEEDLADLRRRSGRDSSAKEDRQ